MDELCRTVYYINTHLRGQGCKIETQDGILQKIPSEDPILQKIWETVPDPAIVNLNMLD